MGQLNPVLPQALWVLILNLCNQLHQPQAIKAHLFRCQVCDTLHFSFLIALLFLDLSLDQLLHATKTKVYSRVGHCGISAIGKKMPQEVYVHAKDGLQI